MNAVTIPCELADDLLVRLGAQAGVLARAALGLYDHIDADLTADVPAVALAIIAPAHARLAAEKEAGR